MTNTNDLDTIRELEELRDIINEAISQANQTIEQARQINSEVVLQELQTACQELNSHQESLERQKNVYDEIINKISDAEAKVNDLDNLVLQSQEILNSQDFEKTRETFAEVSTEFLSYKSQLQELASNVSSMQAHIIRDKEEIQSYYQKNKSLSQRNRSILEELVAKGENHENSVADIFRQSEETKKNIEQIYDDIQYSIEELNLNEIRQNHKALSESLIEAQNSTCKIATETEDRVRQWQAEVSPLETKLNLVQEQIESLVSTASMELTKQAMSLVEDAQQRVRSHEDEILQELSRKIQEVLKDIGGLEGLEELRRSLANYQTLKQTQDKKDQLASEIQKASNFLEKLSNTHLKIQESVPNQNFIRNWLIGLTIGIYLIIVVLVIELLR